MMKIGAVICEDFHGGYIASCPSMPSCKARGRTPSDALEALRKSVLEELAPLIRISPDLLEFNLEGGCASPSV